MKIRRPCLRGVGRWVSEDPSEAYSFFRLKMNKIFWFISTISWVRKVF